MRNVSLSEIESHFLETESHAMMLENWWDELLGDLEKPSFGQFVRWARLYHGNLAALRYAIERAQARNRIRKFNDSAHPVQWISATANNRISTHQSAQTERAA